MSRDPANMNPYEPMYLSDKSVSPSHFATAAALQYWIRQASTLPSSPAPDLGKSAEREDTFGAHRQPRKKRPAALKQPRRAKRERPSQLASAVPDADFVATPSRIPNMSLGEMRKCLNQVRALSPSQLNPDHVLSNGMTLGDFGVAFVDNSVVSAGGATTAGPSETFPGQAPDQLHVDSSLCLQHPRRLKQTCMTDFVNRARTPGQHCIEVPHSETMHMNQ